MRFSRSTALIVVLLFIHSPREAYGQNAGNKAVGINIQAYPAGIIAVGQFTLLPTDNQSWSFTLGFNATDRRDWGEHDNEEGGGFGAGVGWRYYFAGDKRGLLVGARSDMWFLDIDWQDAGRQGGSTEITVLQPTAQLGYAFRRADGPWLIETTASLGAEINVKTEGEPVGEGAILLLGLSVSRRF